MLLGAAVWGLGYLRTGQGEAGTCFGLQIREELTRHAGGRAASHPAAPDGKEIDVQPLAAALCPWLLPPGSPASQC